MNHQEDVLRKQEESSDTFTVFKRRIIQVSQKYASKEKLVPSLAGRLEKCLRLKGGPIGK